MVEKYRLTRVEQETVIRGNATNHDWDVCTADPRIIRKLEKQGYCRDTRKNPWGFVSFTVPFARVRFLRAEKRKVTGAALAHTIKKLRGVSLESVGEDQSSPAMVS
jgi:hypothetical protein